MIKCMHKINNFHLRFDIYGITCFKHAIKLLTIVKMLSSKCILCIRWRRKEKHTKVVNRFLLLVTYLIILSIEISFSLFILLVLLHYILEWVGCFSGIVI